MSFFEDSRGERLPVLLYDEIPSTNTLAKELFLRGELTRGILRAKKQTAGRGRLGRSFFSEDGLYMSLLLPRDLVSLPPALLTSAAAAAVCRILRADGYDACVKWVNDILVNGKKVCGILTEAVSLGSEARAYIIGIGVNTAEVSVPAELRETAVALPNCDPDTLFTRLLPALLEALNESPTEILRTCAAHSSVLGKHVRFFGAETGEGIAEALAPDGGLLVRLRDGTQKHLISGEISVRTEE